MCHSSAPRSHALRNCVLTRPSRLLLPRIGLASPLAARCAPRCLAPAGCMCWRPRPSSGRKCCATARRSYMWQTSAWYARCWSSGQAAQVRRWVGSPGSGGGAAAPAVAVGRQPGQWRRRCSAPAASRNSRELCTEQHTFVLACLLLQSRCGRRHIISNGEGLGLP
jgi:hypothetical protein